MVTVNRSTLWDKKQTGKSMYSLAAAFHGDVGPAAALSLPAYFDKVKNIPYRRDPKGKEVTARPGFLLNHFPALDCKKKAILMGSYFEKNGIPYRFVACSERPDKKIHHVFTQAEIGGKWRNVDPTYAKYKLFEPKRLTRSEVLTKGGSPMNVEGLAGAQLVEMYGDPMGFSIGKFLRKTKDAVGSTARAVQSKVLRPATGAAMTVARSSAGQSLFKSALNATPAGSALTSMLTKRSPGLTPTGTLGRIPLPSWQRPGGMSRSRGGTSSMEAGPGISIPWIIGGGAVVLGGLALAMGGRGRGKEG